MVKLRVKTIHDKTPQTSILLYELQHILVQIKSSAEVADETNANDIKSLSRYGLNMINYAIYAIESKHLGLNITSVSAAAAVSDVFFELQPLAKSFGIQLNLDVGHNLEPVYADINSIKGSVYSLIAATITGLQPTGSSNITIAVQQTKPETQRIGVYSDNYDLSPKIVNRGISDIVRPARMLQPAMTHRSGLGFAVSRELVNQLNAKFSSFCHKNTKGLGFYLPESKQLTLV